MKHKLSNRNTIRKILISLLLYILLIPVFSLIIINSQYKALILLQLIIHYSICYYLVDYFSEGKSLKYDESNLYIINKRDKLCIKIPLKHIYLLEVQLESIEINKPSKKFKLSYFNENNISSEITFHSYLNIRFKNFIDQVKNQNSAFEFKDISPS